MILQALTEYYEALVSQGKLAPPGWADAKISFALGINDAGELTQVFSLKTEQSRGAKTVLAPQSISLPAPLRHSSDITANFLFDDSSYILGISSKGKPERNLACFGACRKLYHQILSTVDSPAAKAVLAYFDQWNPALASQHSALKQDLKEICSGVKLVFWYRDGYLQDDPMIRNAWQLYYDVDGNDTDTTICLVTGKIAPMAKTHPPILGAGGTNPKLVSFDKDSPAFCSYGKEQGANAPTSKYAAFAYTAALNDLLADRAHTQRIGDTTVLFWARSGQSAFQTAFSAWACGSPSLYDAADLSKMLSDLLKGVPVQYEDTLLDPNMDFYILGLSPNKGRLSVRFFLRNTFGGFLKNVQRHNARLEIVRPSSDPFETIPLWKLLDETVNQKSQNSAPAPELAGETLRSILTDTRYPAFLLNGVILRIRAERHISPGRAAILKAYYTKLAEINRRDNPDIPKEVLTVSLNPDSTSIPYNLGRLFSVLEAIQSAANPNINATIKDKYFNSASATPSRVFPALIDLAQKHLRKLDKGLAVSYDRQLTDLLGRLGQDFPDRMNLPQQGAFQLGYYHQKQARYQKKEEK